MFAEIAARRRFRAVEPTAEINSVQVQLHDLLLREVLLDATREENLEQLPSKRPLLERERIARELLRHRARTLPDMSRSEVPDCGADDPEEIVAAVLVKFRVLHRNDRVNQV